MNSNCKHVFLAAALAAALILTSANAQQGKTEVVQATLTPDKIKTQHLGTLNFRDGIPDAATAQKLYDELDYIYAVDAFISGYPGVSQHAIRKGFIEAGINDNDAALMSGLMNASSIFLTGNADTVYLWSYLDLTKGPLVVEAPPGMLGLLDDMWWQWMGDFGLSGPDRGEGGKYLVLPPGYDGPLPEGGFVVYSSKTYQASFLGRAFLVNNDPKPVVANIKDNLRIYPYQPGSQGSSIGAFLNGTGPLAGLSQAKTPRFVEGTDKSMNTIPPADYSYFEMLNEVVQSQPADAIDPERMGKFAAIGIVKGKPFNPDARMKKILTEAAAVANAASRAVLFDPRPEEGFHYYGADSTWTNSLFMGGYEFLTPPPEITSEGVKPFPSDGARKLNARNWFFYLATGITPAMCMRLENVGSQYLLANFDSKGAALDGAKTYTVTLPPDIPAARFWSFTVYDNQTRSMLDTPQRYPRAGSQSYPSPAATANPDGSTTVYFGPTQPNGVDRGNWIQTTPGKGWFTILRFYSPLQPFFDKSWKVGEVEPVR